MGASANFSDPEWDGEPIPEEPPEEKPEKPFEPGEEDDGKFAMMINKGLLCDKDSVIFARYVSEGYRRAFRGINMSGMYTYILLKSELSQDGKWTMVKMLILEVDSISKVACVVSENIQPEYNQNLMYLELKPIFGESL